VIHYASLYLHCDDGILGIVLQWYHYILLGDTFLWRYYIPFIHTDILIHCPVTYDGGDIVMPHLLSILFCYWCILDDIIFYTYLQCSLFYLPCDTCSILCDTVYTLHLHILWWCTDDTIFYIVLHDRYYYSMMTFDSRSIQVHILILSIPLLMMNASHAIYRYIDDVMIHSSLLFWFRYDIGGTILTLLMGSDVIQIIHYDTDYSDQ